MNILVLSAGTVIFDEAYGSKQNSVDVFEAVL